jgi:hypothetical protein
LREADKHITESLAALPDPIIFMWMDVGRILFLPKMKQFKIYLGTGKQGIHQTGHRYDELSVSTNCNWKKGPFSLRTIHR